MVKDRPKGHRIISAFVNDSRPGTDSLPIDTAETILRLS